MSTVLVAVLFAAAHAVSPTVAGAAGPATGTRWMPQDTPFVSVLAPGIRYDPSIPTLASVTGHDFDDDITHPDEIAAYLQALAAAAPARTHLIEYARTWEGRPVHMLVIGAPERIARLDQVKENLRRLAHPAGLGEAEAEQLMASLPVVVAMVHNIHGNEISGGGAGMAEAYHLLAATNDPRVDAVMAEALVLIDPIQNPDGRARFVGHWRQTRAFPPDGDPASVEHDEPWPGGRGNHYHFDLNRDWFALTQPESRGKIRALLDFNPHVVADLHEMGGNSTYYFPPAAIPGNPWTTAAQHAMFEVLGRAMAEAFDTRGFPYFTRETFDSYYPGYGASWPTTQGAMGMTFEQASARGLVYLRSDGDLLTYGDGVLHHFTAALTTMATAAANRERILREFLAFRRSAMDLPRRGGPAAYVLHSRHDPELAGRLATLLARNGIEVRRAEEAVRIGNRTVGPTGTYIVPGGQPAARLARNLLDPYTPMSEDFVRRQIERRARRLSDEIYDITAWSLPLLWDVEALATDRVPQVRSAPVAAEPPAPSPMALPAARVGYLMPWSTATASAVAEALRDGLRVRVLLGPITIGGRSYGVGAALLRTPENPAGLPGRLGAIAARHGAIAYPVDDSFQEEGISLGSNRVDELRLPRVLLVYGRPGSSYSVGWARYVLEQRYGVPVTAVRADAAGRVLDDHDVVVLPSGSYGSVFGESGVAALRNWVRAGGTLVTMAASSRWAAQVGLLSTTTELRGGAPEFGGERTRRREPMDQPIDLLETITPVTEQPEQTPGAILNVVMDTTHWLSAGTDGRIGAMVASSRIFTPITLDEGTNVGVYAPLDELVAGGIVWQDARPQLASKAFLVHQQEGRGQLVAFAEDPNYRAYAEATQLLFVNAVLVGAAR